MASKLEWERAVRDLAKGEGVYDIALDYTNNNHLRVTGKRTLSGGRVVGIRFVCGSHRSDGDPRALHNVRADIRRIVRSMEVLSQ